MTKPLALALSALAAATIAMPAAQAAPGICKYYKVYNPVNNTTTTYDLTWCNL